MVGSSVTLVSNLLGRRLNLTRRERDPVVVGRDLTVPVEEGVVWLADHYALRASGRRPTVQLLGLL
jgi:hypothetical protein